MFSSSSTRPVVLAGLSTLSALIVVGQESPSTLGTLIDPSLPSLITAKVGILPSFGGISLDLVLLGLLGAGYAMVRLHRSAPTSAPRKSDHHQKEPAEVPPESKRPFALPSG